MMTDLMMELYEFTCQRRLGYGLDCPEYREYLHAAQAQETCLQSLLDSDGKQVLRDMLYERSCQHAMEQQAMFQASFALCKELHGILG